VDYERVQESPTNRGGGITAITAIGGGGGGGT
jgi:hypothetical protein